MNASLFQNLSSAMRPKAEAQPKPAPAPEPRTRRIVFLPVSVLETDPDQPRKSFPELPELAQSIRTFGVRQPLLVRPLPEEPGRYRLISGERRLRAARHASLQEVPCLIEKDVEDEGRLRALQLVENLQRKDLTLTETAGAIQTILESTDLEKGELARLLGKAPNWISKYLALLQAEGPAAEALEEGLVKSPETYRLFQHLPEEHQQEILSQARDNQQPIARRQVLEQGSKAEATPAPATSPPPPAPEPAPARTTDVRPDEEEEPTFTLRLTAGQIVQILRKFEAVIPEEPEELMSALYELLSRIEEGG